MDSNTLFEVAALKYLPVALIIEIVIIFIYAVAKRRYPKDKTYWQKLGIFTFGVNLVIFFITFGYLVLRPKEVREKVVTLEPETITEINIIEKENVIEVPSIMLPLEPEGNQAVLIDVKSLKMKEFMEGFYGENVYFFNNRQDATYLAKSEGLTNYSGLDISEIEYSQTDTITTINLDDMKYETVWVFSDLSYTNIISSDTKVMLYVPRQLTDEELQKLKQTNSDITIIAIEQIS